MARSSLSSHHSDNPMALAVNTTIATRPTSRQARMSYLPAGSAPPMYQPMYRREFLQAGAASLALSAVQGFAAEFADRKPIRVSLIGCGWYGKCDLFRLLQVAPVEVV